MIHGKMRLEKAAMHDFKACRSNRLIAPNRYFYRAAHVLYTSAFGVKAVLIPVEGNSIYGFPTVER
jgi:hypothetical protein